MINTAQISSHTHGAVGVRPVAETKIKWERVKSKVKLIFELDSVQSDDHSKEQEDNIQKFRAKCGLNHHRK